ncbi:peptidylprolyl isomerase [Bacteriovorax sp. Seq25_V]|uniref:peptidylprolyl isomerase n=1 Tax=Bacteriovorax sp. Seq25_V TaxID=1201288 RepID=UPI00038A1E4D|nr:peptidylprolyl isomerase [Bacteriovorax sp. Seq25_V]EQC43433.1 peptidyl-prolyl cis-trans isomerase, cyclophilin-type [Bacteriovorax sp. Seq25_V]
MFFVLFLCSCTKNKETFSPEETISPEISLNAFDLETDNDGLSRTKAVLKTVHGNISFKFYPKSAPNTVTRLLQLINEGFYDGLSFHRVIPGFVIQTGDPTGSGKGGSGNILKAEINELQHIKGTIAMARSHNNIDSADSQFYISLSSLPHLDGKYTIFGQVIEGIDVLDKIQKGDKILSIQIIR